MINVNCALRRIHDHTVWYLHSCDMDYNKAVWTHQFQKAHQFLNEQEAMDFARIFLGRDRARECDVLSEFETWTI